MNEKMVGVRQLKTRLSEYLRQVKDGQTIVITEHGKPVGRIVPTAHSLEERVQLMAKSGLIAWSGKKLRPHAPKARVRGKRSVSDVLIENRE